MSVGVFHQKSSGFFPFDLPRKSWYTDGEFGPLTEIPLAVMMQWYWLCKTASFAVNVTSSVNEDVYGDGSDVRYGTSTTTGVMPAISAPSTPAERCSPDASGGTPIGQIIDEGVAFSTNTDYTYSGYDPSDPSDTYSSSSSDTDSFTDFIGWLGDDFPYLLSDDSGSFNTLFVPTPRPSITVPVVANMSLSIDPDATAGSPYYTMALSDVIFTIVAPWGTVTIPVYIVTLTDVTASSASGNITLTLTEVWS